MLSAVFRFQLPSLSSHPVLSDLLRSFCLESAERQLRPPAWDLSMVLRYLNRVQSFCPILFVQSLFVQVISSNVSLSNDFLVQRLFVQ